MSDETRSFPALAFPAAAFPADSDTDLLLAMVDDAAPTALDVHEGLVRVFFHTAAARDHAVRLLAGRAGYEPRPMDVPDESWAERSQAMLGAMRVGHLVVAPPWIAPEPDAVWIVIQPSMGFGTGHHESTRLCLSLLQEVPVAGRSALDLGTGSGVLAVAAWRLGASPVTAVDYDPDAIACARDSVARAGGGTAIEVRTADLSAPAPRDLSPCDVVMANLTGDTLVRHAATIVGLTRSGGRIILGGILASEEARVATAFAREGTSLVAQRAEGEWVGLLYGIPDTTSPSGSTAR